MTQKCDLICFSNVRALSHHLCCCFSLSVFPQRPQERSSPLNTKSVPSCPIFSLAIYELLCSYITGCYGADWGLCFTAAQLMTLAVGYFTRLSCRSLFGFCLVPVCNTSTASHLLLIYALIRGMSLKRAASAGFGCRIFNFCLSSQSQRTCL